MRRQLAVKVMHFGGGGKALCVIVTYKSRQKRLLNLEESRSDVTEMNGKHGPRQQGIQ